MGWKNGARLSDFYFVVVIVFDQRSGNSASSRGNSKFYLKVRGKSGNFISGWALGFLKELISVSSSPPWDACLASPADFAGADDIITNLAK